MKKTSFLGYALTLALAIVAGNAMGQVAGGGNFVKTGDDDGDDANKFSLVQAGKPFGYFVQPDAAFHPGYNVAGSWTLTTGFTWSWAPVTGVTITPGAAANYVTLEAANAGIFEMSVTEKAPDIWNLTCDLTPKTFKLIAFPAPSFEIGASEQSTPYCGEQTAYQFQPVIITSSGAPYVKYKVEKFKATLNAAGILGKGTKIGDLTAETTATFSADAWEYDVAAAESASEGPATITVNSALVTTGTPALAKYNFVYKNNLSAPAADGSEGSVIAYELTVSGVNGLISRKADYDQVNGTHTGDFTLYGTEGSKIVYIALAPKTGPVYHLGNNLAK